MIFLQFHIYNLLLRQYPYDLFKRFQDGGNLFATTIYVLCSAINKLAQNVMIIEGTLLYRGLGGLMEFPDSFFFPDENGRRGYVEWGFLSTTSNKETALQYSGVKEGKPKAMVIEFPVTSIDRGGSVKVFSQYPQVIDRSFLFYLSKVSPSSVVFFCLTLFLCYLTHAGS